MNELLPHNDLILRLAFASAIAVFVATVGYSYFQAYDMRRRMKAVTTERDRVRERERAKAAQDKGELRFSNRGRMNSLAQTLNLDKHLAQEDAKQKLQQAGFRNPSAYMGYLASRLVCGIGFFFGVLFYTTVVTPLDQPFFMILLISLFGAFIGLQLPMLLLKNKISKRQAEIRRAFPDALDLTLICVEGGMTPEVAFKKVSLEIANQSMALAEELALTTAELSFLSDRRQAYDNLAARTGLDSMKAIATALVQSEKYGTPMGQTLRVLAQETRDMRMAAAEKKAAGLPPKLTVPMIVFFLPVLFVAILSPAYLRYQKENTGEKIDNTTAARPKQQ